MALQICISQTKGAGAVMKTSNEQVPPTETQNNILGLNIPIEELLGSVTTYNNVEGSDNKSQQLRTSARVFKKMKLDTSAAVAPLTPDKKELPVKEDYRLDTKKRIWTPEEKSLFFEALNEFGKDFDSIQNYISNKLKKRGLPESAIKTRDQIRHIYHRTFHKISKHLKFSSDIKKVAQELYALINYGELRKKIGSVSEKNCIKLNELIYTGSVAIRRRGKTIRVRTPMCRALRKLNQLEEAHDDIKLPSRVVVELRPKDMDSFMRVQSCAQNPLLRTVLPLQKRLSCLINCAMQKWQTQFASNYEKTLAAVNSFTESCLPDIKVSEECKRFLNPPLRLVPPPDAKIEIPSFNLTEYLTCQSVCLNSYEERVGVKIPGEQLWQWPWGKNPCKRGTKRARNESSSEKLAKEKPTDPALETAAISEQAETSTNNNEGGAVDYDIESSFNNAVEDAVNTLLALTKQDIIEEKPPESSEAEVERKAEEVEKKQETINRIRQGWSSEDCGTVSIGELYLMFGADGKLILEYSWDLPDIEKIKTETDEVGVTAESNQEDPTRDSSDKTECDLEEENPPNDLNLSLQRLLSVAKLHYRKNMIKCPCGHVCGGNTKNSSQKQKTVGGKKNSDAGMCDKSVQFPEASKERGCITRPSSSTFVPIGPHPHVRQYSPAALLQKHINFKSQLEKLQPRFCNRRGRPRAKQVVVERKLPLLANKADSGHEIVQMNIISQENMDGIESEPTHQIVELNIVSQPVSAAPTENFVVGKSVEAKGVSTSLAANVTPVFNTVEAPSTSMGLPVPVDVTDNAVMSSSRVSSPTSISNLLEMALGPQNEQQNSGDVNKGTAEMASFAGLLSDNSEPPSPSRILKDNDNQWLNSEVSDFSLSSFLGHLDSPVKPTPAPSTTGDESRLSQDVDVQLQSLLTESSIDYTAKFADLAAQVISDIKKQ